MKRVEGQYDIKYKGVWTTGYYRPEFPNFGWEVKRHPILLEDRDLDEIDESPIKEDQDQLWDEVYRMGMSLKDASNMIEAWKKNFTITRNK